MKAPRFVPVAMVALLVLPLLAPPATAHHDGSSEYDYTFAWDAWNGELTEASGETAENDSTTLRVDVDRTNLTRLLFTLTWHDDVGEPDHLEFRIRSPDGTTYGPVDARADDGELTLNATFGAMPTGEAVVRAHDAAEAWRNFTTQHPPATHGKGTWDVTVTVRDAGDEEGLLVNDKDEDQTWTLTVHAEGYRGILEDREEVPAPTPDPDPDPDPGPDDNRTGNLTNDTGDVDDDPDEVSYEGPPENEPPWSAQGVRVAIVVGGALLGVIAALGLARRANP